MRHKGIWEAAYLTSSNRHVEVLSDNIPGLSAQDLDELNNSSPKIRAMVFLLVEAILNEENVCTNCRDFDDYDCEDCAQTRADLEDANLLEVLDRFRNLRMTQTSLHSKCETQKDEIDALNEKLGTKREFEEWVQKLNNFIPSTQRELDL